MPSDKDTVEAAVSEIADISEGISKMIEHVKLVDLVGSSQQNTAFSVATLVSSVATLGSAISKQRGCDLATGMYLSVAVHRLAGLVG